MSVNDDVGADDRQHQSGQSRARTDVADASGPHERRDERAVEHVPGPQAGEFERADQAELLAVARERRRECPAGVECVAEQLGGGRRLRLESVDHRFT